MTNPQRIDFHQRDVPRPIDVSGCPSPRRTRTSRATALAQISDSFQIVEAKVGVGAKYDTVCRMSNNPNNDTNRPTQVAAGTFVAVTGCSFIFNHWDVPNEQTGFKRVSISIKSEKTVSELEERSDYQLQ